MVLTPDSLLYCVADTMNLELFEVDGKIRGAEQRKVRIGPFTLEAEVVVVSDVLKEDSAGLFARIHGKLWLYIVSLPNATQYVFGFDSSVVNLHVKDATSFGGKSVAATLSKLGKALTVAYEFKQNKWIEQNVSDLVKAASAESYQRA